MIPHANASQDHAWGFIPRSDRNTHDIINDKATRMIREHRDINAVMIPTLSLIT